MKDNNIQERQDIEAMTFDERVRKIEMYLNDTEDDIIEQILNREGKISRMRG